MSFHSFSEISVKLQIKIIPYNFYLLGLQILTASVCLIFIRSVLVRLVLNFSCEGVLCKIQRLVSHMPYIDVRFIFLTLCILPINHLIILMKHQLIIHQNESQQYILLASPTYENQYPICDF